MIGIFDSGSGGLTVLKAIRDVLPSANVLYFGDIKNAPYGSRPREELSTLTVNAIQLLQNKGAKHIVSACNSVSASLAVSLLDLFSITQNQLIEMVGPTVGYFRGSPARVLLCATPATIRSGIYQDGFRMIGKEVATVAIPELAGAIEFGGSEEDMRRIITQAFEHTILGDFDVLLLCCTHFPLVTNLFQELEPKIPIFDPALAVAERVEKQFWPQEVGDGKTTFLISKDSSLFRGFVAKLFPKGGYSIEVIQ